MYVQINDLEKKDIIGKDASVSKMMCIVFGTDDALYL